MLFLLIAQAALDPASWLWIVCSAIVVALVIVLIDNRTKVDLARQTRELESTSKEI